MERKGEPSAVVTSTEQYQSLKAQQEAAAQRLEALAERNAHLDPDQVLAEVTEEVERVRQERYEQQQQAAESRR